MAPSTALYCAKGTLLNICYHNAKFFKTQQGTWNGKVVPAVTAGGGNEGGRKGGGQHMDGRRKNSDNTIEISTPRTKVMSDFDLTSREKATAHAGGRAP
eukprot:1753493-Rhodomonas_salina.3